MEVLEFIIFLLMSLGIVWFYYDLSNRYNNLKSRVDILETVLEVMQQGNDDE